MINFQKFTSMHEPVDISVFGLEHAKTVFDVVLREALAPERELSKRFHASGLFLFSDTTPEKAADSVAFIEACFNDVWSIELHPENRIVDRQKELVIAHLNGEDDSTFKILLIANGRRTLATAWDGGMPQTVSHMQATAMSVAQTSSELLSISSPTSLSESPWITGGFDINQVLEEYSKARKASGFKPVYLILKTKPDSSQKILFMSGDTPETSNVDGRILDISDCRPDIDPFNGTRSELWGKTQPKIAPPHFRIIFPK